jgi:hypothetical protein
MRRRAAKVASGVKRSRGTSLILEQAHHYRMKRWATTIRKSEECLTAAKKLIKQSKELLRHAS